MFIRKELKDFFSRFQIPETPAYLTITLTAAVLSLYGVLYGPENTGGIFGTVAYFGTLGKDPFEHLFKWLCVGGIFSGFFALVVFFARSWLAGEDPVRFFSRQFLVHVFKRLNVYFHNVLNYALAPLLALTLTVSAVGATSVLRLGNLADNALLVADVILFGSRLAVASVSYPPAAAFFIEWSYRYVLLLFIFFVAALFVFNVQLFRRLSSAFCLSLFILLPLWALIPAVGPEAFFNQHLSQLELHGYVTAQVYRINSVYRSFAAAMEKENAAADVLPVSTFPSAHVAWAVIFLVFAYRLNKFLGLIAFPVVVFSIVATFALGQHYIVDTPAGVFVAVLSIVLADTFFLREKI